MHLKKMEFLLLGMVRPTDHEIIAIEKVAHAFFFQHTTSAPGITMGSLPSPMLLVL
jgi:hypothetical protein